VQVDQQPAPAPRPGARRHDHVDPELAADGLAVNIQVDELIAVLVGELGIARAEVASEKAR